MVHDRPVEHARRDGRLRAGRSGRRRDLLLISCATRRWAPTCSPARRATWRAKKIIVVKSSQHFYASFSKVAQARHLRRRAGRGDADLKTLPYQKIRRPKWPIEPPDPGFAATCLSHLLAPENPTHATPNRSPASPPVLLVPAAARRHGAAGAVAQSQDLAAWSPHADLRILDPILTTAYITRNHGYMVYDTLFAHGRASSSPKPQMVDKWTTSKDGKQLHLHAARRPEVLTTARR